MTLPRNLTLSKIGATITLLNYPLKAMDKLSGGGVAKDLSLKKDQSLTLDIEHLNQSELQFTTASRDFKVIFTNDLGEKLEVGLNDSDKELTVDRRNSGKVDFQEAFGNKLHQVPLHNLPQEAVEFRFYLDWSSLELFINGGQYVSTCQVFPTKAYNKLIIENISDTDLKLEQFIINEVKSVW